jgi:hypothetical protein
MCPNIRLPSPARKAVVDVAETSRGQGPLAADRRRHREPWQASPVLFPPELVGGRRAGRDDCLLVSRRRSGAGASSANPSGTSQVVDRRPPSRVPSAISNRGFNECQDGRATPPPERDPFSVGPLRSAMTAQRRLPGLSEKALQLGVVLSRARGPVGQRLRTTERDEGTRGLEDRSRRCGGVRLGIPF